jgi:peptidyl-prolyl cis-trans isomerase C
MSAPRELPAPGDVDGSDSQVVAASLLRVNGDYLTVDDILRAAADRLKELPADMPEQAFRTSAAQIIQQTIDQQVLQTLVYAEAGRRLSDEQNKYIDRELERKLREMVANAGGSRTRLEEDLAVQGTDLKTVAKDARRDMSVSLFLNQRFQPAITVTRGMLWDYYQQHISEYSTPRQVQMQIIAAPFADFISATAPSDADVSAARSAARALVEQARAAVAGGEDFGAVARGLSRGVKASGGGLWPMMPAGSFRERPVERAAFTMNEGQVSDVIETDTGCYLVKVRKVEAGTVVSFEDAQQRIDQALRREKAARLEQEYLDKLLRRSDVNQDRRFIPLAVDRATDLYHRG